MAGKYVRMPPPASQDTEGEPESNVLQNSEGGDLLHTLATEELDQAPEWPTAHRLKVLENSVVEIAQMMLTLKEIKESKGPVDPKEDPNWGCRGNIEASGSSSAPRGNSSIKLDHVRPFPKDVPANRLWEEWRKYIENFEIAASLNEISEPDRLAKVLYLAVGEELQGIINAARLRPSLTGPDCYKVFVDNIDAHLRSMTDATTEHETFMAMRQDIGESAVAFHARLVERVRLCQYNRKDEDRFIRLQLVKGLANQELAKTARLFNYDTNFIVQAATRSEAHEPAAGPSGLQTVLAIDHGNGSRLAGNKRPSSRVEYRESESTQEGRRKAADYSRGQPQKQRRFGKGKRNKCSRCNHWSHDEGQRCPALDAKCYSCGRSGHFSATCRKREVNSTRQDVNEKSTNSQV